MTIDLDSCKAMMSYNYHNNCCIAAVTLPPWQHCQKVYIENVYILKILQINQKQNEPHLFSNQEESAVNITVHGRRWSESVIRWY